jgi:GNAT superfamily N-acetyltransferase
VSDVLRDMSRAAWTRAVEANLTAFHVLLSDWPEIILHRDDDRIWTVSQRRFSLCNVVLEARFSPTDVDTQIERALTPYLASNVNVMWKLGPSTQPGDLGDRLLKQGFLVRPTLRGMALNLASLGPIPALAPGVDIREVGDTATLDLWRRAVDRGFGWPSYGSEDLADNLAHFLRTGVERPFVAYVAVSGEEAVASSLVFLGAGVAGIYHVSTVPDYRGRGLGSVITAAPLLEARSRRYRIAVLHATEMGYPIYRRLGFEQVCDIGMRLRLRDSVRCGGL